MLELNCEDDTMHECFIGNLRCEIQIPSCLSGFFDIPQSEPVMADDRRRYKRWNCRNVGALECRQTLAHVKRTQGWSRIFLKDVSLGGLAFLHSEQLFPLEQMRILLPEKVLKPLAETHRKRIVEVVRCRKHGNRCYEIGAMYVDEFRHSPPIANIQDRSVRAELRAMGVTAETAIQAEG